MSSKTTRTMVAAVLTVCALLGSACTTPSHHHDHPMAESVTLKNQWASSAETGMAAVFGTFANAGHHEARIVSGTSPVAGRVEVHEVLPDAAGDKTMRPKANGVTVPAGETRELIPGGDHLMLMELKQPLQPGADVPLTVVFEDGSTLPITAQVRDFAGPTRNTVQATGAAGHHTTMAEQAFDGGFAATFSSR